MSDKFFFKGKINKKPKHFSHSFNTNRQVKLGSEELPIEVYVQNDTRADEVLTIAQEHDLIINITIDDNQDEDINALNSLIEKPYTVILEKTPGRNDSCSCGSQLKYKKCCGK